MCDELTSAAVVAAVESTAAAHGCQRLLLAYSGGLDSTVLLDLLAGHSSLPLRALFVDHGLQPVVSRWRETLHGNCAARGIALETRALAQRPPAGASVEAFARAARYRQIADVARDDELVLLAQHERDQAETLLLQLLRGGGPDGLAAMPAVFRRHARWMLRPLLQHSEAEIRAYAAARALDWFDDPTNAETRFDRNFLRHEVMPIVRQRWPGADTTLARAASWQAESARILAQQAAADAQRLGVRGTRLPLPAFNALPAERRRNVLRFLFRAAGWPPPPAARLRSVLALCRQASGRGRVDWGSVGVRRYREVLFLVGELAALPDGDWSVRVTRDGVVALPAGLGALQLAGLPDAQVTVGLRRGGERVRERTDGHSVPLARWFQQRGVPPWLRQRTPLVWIAGEIAAIGEHVLPRCADRWPRLRVQWRQAP